MPSDFAHTVFDLGTLGGSDTLWARLVQNNGQTTGWQQFTVVAAPAFQGLGLAPDSTSFASGLSADGTVVVGAAAATPHDGMQAFRWTASTGMAVLGFLPGGAGSNASGTNADGSVVVGSSAQYGSNSNEAVRWTSSTGMVGLGFLSGVYSEATATNSDGSVVVGESDYSLNGPSEAFRWTAATGMVGLGFLPGGQSSIAQAVKQTATSFNGTIQDGVSTTALTKTGTGTLLRRCGVWRIVSSGG